MSKYDVYRSVELYPVAALILPKRQGNGKDPVLTDPAIITEKIAKTIMTVRDMEYWGRNNNTVMPKYYMAIYDGAHPESGEKFPSKKNNEIARVIGYRYQDYLPDEMLVKSRVERLIGHNHINADKIMGEKYKTYNGEKYASRGKKRTFSWVPPSPSNAINLGAAPNNYSEVTQHDNLLSLDIVAYDVKARLFFKIPEKYVNNEKIAKPIISLDKNGKVHYNFSVKSPRYYPTISSKYVIGTDVGIVKPYIAALIDIKTKEIVKILEPSARVKQLDRKIKITQEQVRSMYKKMYKDYGKYHYLEEEIAQQRIGITRRKREMAILVAQEIARFSIENDNAVIAVEELSWIENTNYNGRWSRGLQVKWLKHYANLQGLLCYSVNAANSSKECYSCGARGYLLADRLFHCSLCKSSIDRDVNAAAVIGARVVESALKSAVTRDEKRVERGVADTVVPVVVPERRESLGKGRPTPKRVKKKVVKRRLEPVIKNYFGSCAEGRVGDSEKRTLTQSSTEQPPHVILLALLTQQCSIK